MANALAVESNTLDHTDGALDRQQALAFGERLRARAAEVTRTSVQLRQESGIKKQSMTGYWNGDRLPGSDKLFALADALGVNARWLARGEGPKTAGNLLNAAEADFVSLPKYDLGQLGEDGKGSRVETIPIRRDWLYRRLLTTAGLWITELPASYDELNLLEGDVVICSDIAAGDPPPDNTTCIFLGDGLFVARYRSRWVNGSGDMAGPRVGPLDLTEHNVQPIARIRARMLANI